MAELQSQSPRRKAWRLSIVIALAALLALVAPSAPTALALPGDPAPANAEQGMVQIKTVIQYQGVVGFGAGVVLSPDGIVLTNNHVIAGADTINATSVGTGQNFRAQLLGFDRTDDIAVIQLLGAGGLPAAPIGDSNQVAVGEPVVSLGNANGNGRPADQSRARQGDNHRREHRRRRRPDRQFRTVDRSDRGRCAVAAGRLGRAAGQRRRPSDRPERGRVGELSIGQPDGQGLCDPHQQGAGHSGPDSVEDAVGRGAHRSAGDAGYRRGHRAAERIRSRGSRRAERDARRAVRACFAATSSSRSTASPSTTRPC